MLKEGNARFVAGQSEHPHTDARRVEQAGTENQGDHAYATVMIAADGEHGRESAQLTDQISEPRQFFSLIDQIAAEQQGVDAGNSRRCDDLAADRIATAAPQVDIADVQ